MSGDMNSNSSL